MEMKRSCVSLLQEQVYTARAVVSVDSLGSNAEVLGPLIGE